MSNGGSTGQSAAVTGAATGYAGRRARSWDRVTWAHNV